MHCQCWGNIKKKIKWKFLYAFEILQAEKWDTLNSLNFQPDKLLPQHAIMFKGDTKLSFACTHTDIVSTHKWVMTSFFHVGFQQPTSLCVYPCPSHFGFLPSDDAFDMTVLNRNRSLKGKMQGIVMFVCFHPGQQFRYSKGSEPNSALTIHSKTLQLKKTQESAEPNLHLWAQYMYCKRQLQCFGWGWKAQVVWVCVHAQLHARLWVFVCLCVVWQQTSLRRTSNHSIQHLLPHSSYCHSPV